jgi:hypothetical protein
MGRSRGLGEPGIYIFHDDLHLLRPWFLRRLTEAGDPFILPNNAYVLSSYLSEQFHYFVAEPGNDDPPVLHYIELEEAPCPVFDSITSALVEYFVGDDVVLD